MLHSVQCLSNTLWLRITINLIGILLKLTNECLIFWVAILGRFCMVWNFECIIANAISDLFGVNPESYFSRWFIRWLAPSTRAPFVFEIRFSTYTFCRIIISICFCRCVSHDALWCLLGWFNWVHRFNLRFLCKCNAAGLLSFDSNANFELMQSLGRCADFIPFQNHCFLNHFLQLDFKLLFFKPSNPEIAKIDERKQKTSSMLNVERTSISTYSLTFSLFYQYNSLINCYLNINTITKMLNCINITQ